MIEDSTEALGGSAYGKKAGEFGKYSALSFNGNKIITSSGGGMILTDNKEDRDRALFLATQAKEKVMHYEHKEIGYNYRLSNISAAIGVAQLEQLERKVEEKRHIYNKYKEGLKNIEEIKMFDDPKDQHTNKWLSIAIMDDSKTNKTPIDLIMYLNDKNIESRRIWKPMHMQPVYSDADYIKLGDKDISKEIFEKGICLPSDINMTDDEQDYVIEQIKEFFKKN